ncbi:hypothetical protein DL98DRAFT_628320 [Cadophora sp. DSE1049]|nr:hypothetical protein DL98DRAFT_628320 [Cadophora sp. DSE1049]
MSAKFESVPFLADDESDGIPTADTRKSCRTSRIATWMKNLANRILSRASGLSHMATILATSFVWGGILVSTKFPGHATQGHGAHIPDGTYHELGLSDVSDFGHFASNTRFLSCGFSISEAEKLGCKYDILVGKWLPSFCIDQAAIDEYKVDGSWFGYADWNRTELLTVSQMGERDVYYTSERDHIVHCAMLWMKQYQVFFEGRTVFDSIIASKEHTHHCAKFLIDMTDHGTEWRTMPISVFVGQAGCFVRA